MRAATIIRGAFLTAFMAFAALAANAQRPDEEDVMARTLSASSPYYYPTLMDRYMTGDTTLTLTEYHYLYYGYIYTGDYRPLDPVPGRDMILQIFSLHPEPDRDQASEIIRYASQVMASDPFSPSNLNYLTYAYGILGDSVQERLFADRFEKVLGVIDSSGDGTREATAKHVLYFSHAMDFVTARGYGYRSSHVVSNKVEYIFFPEKADGQRGMYFDYSRVYLIRPEEIPQRPKGWTINNSSLSLGSQQ